MNGIQSRLIPAVALMLAATVRAETVQAPTTRPSPSGPTVKFRIPEHDLYPESIAFDPVSEDFFLSSMGRRRILRIHPDGSYEDFVPSTTPGLESSIGMKVDAERRALWVCTGRFSLLKEPGDAPPRTGVLRFDIDSGELLQSWIFREAQASPYHIFNDIELSRTGKAYVTTTLIGRLLQIAPGAEEPLLIHQLDEGSHNNGITLGPKERYLYETVDRRIERVDLVDGGRVALDVPDDAALGTDGLYFHDGSLIAVRPRFNSVMRFHLEDDLRTVHRVEALVEGHPEMAYPTTGVVTATTFVYVATSFADVPRSTGREKQHPVVLIHEIPLER